MSNRSAAAVEDSKTFIIVCSSVAFIAGLSTTLWMAIGRRPSIRKTLIGQSMGAHQSAFKDALKAFGFGTALCASGAVSLTYITRSIEQLSSKLRSNLAALRPQQAATETSAEETVQQELETAMKELNNLLLLNNESAEEC